MENNKYQDHKCVIWVDLEIDNLQLVSQGDTRSSLVSSLSGTITTNRKDTEGFASAEEVESGYQKC